MKFPESLNHSRGIAKINSHLFRNLYQENSSDRNSGTKIMATTIPVIRCWPSISKNLYVQDALPRIWTTFIIMYVTLLLFCLSSQRPILGGGDWIPLV